MSLTTSRLATLYRLTGAADMIEYLTTPGNDAEWKDEIFQKNDLRCLFRYGHISSSRPTWQSHVESLLGRSIILPSVDPFAVLLIEQLPWIYALTWGAGYELINDEFVEQGFGLSFGIRRLDEFRLGSVTSHALDNSSRVAQISFPRGTDFGSFGVRRHGELVSQLKGKADLSDLECGRNSKRTSRVITTSDSLKIPLAYKFDNLDRDIHLIAHVTDSPEPENALRAIAQVRPLRPGHRLISELDGHLSEALGGAEVGRLDLGWPVDSSIDFSEAESFCLTSLWLGRKIHIQAPLTLSDLVDKARRLNVSSRMEALKKGHVQAYSDVGGTEKLGGGNSARKWISYEILIDNNRYVLRGGKWYRIGEAYVQQIRDEVARLLARKASLNFPLWTPTGRRDDENLYCHEVARCPDLICLDRSFAATARHRKIELCDIFGPNDELIHAKWLSDAPAFSHLISQAEASMSALQNEPEAIEWLQSRVSELTSGVRRIGKAPDKIILAGAGRSWNVDELFAMSQISLLRFVHGLPTNVSVEFLDIPFVPKVKPRSPGKHDLKPPATARKSPRLPA